MDNHPAPRLRQTTHLLLLGTFSLCAYPAMAQQASDSWLNQPTLTADWGGLRTTLQDDGITVRAHWTTESAGNLSGGRYQTARYTQQFDLGADFDLDRLWGLPDAKIQFTLTDRSGRSLSADAIGNQFAVQELYGAGQNFRLAELNYQQDLLDHKVSIELGWSPIGDHFANLPAFCDFQNGVICGHANAMTVNSGAHNFPTAEWGARIEVRPTPGFYVATGVYQVNPDEGNANEGFNLSFKSTGAFIPVELGWKTDRDSGELPGNIKIGAYYNTSDAPDVLTDVNGLSAGLTDGSFEEHNGRSGGYILANHMIYREGPDSDRGLYLGAMAGMGDAATSRFRYFWMAGGHFQGTFPGRDDDIVAFMIAYARTNSRLTRYQEDLDSVTLGVAGIQTYESVAEIDYGARITPWLVLRPNLQYVIHPGGTGKIPNAFVIGLYTQVSF